jgi:hypothetical protein
MVVVRMCVAGAILVGLLGPCVCAPAAAVAPAAHGCCDAEAGLKPAPADCCAGCSTSAGDQASALLREAPPSVGVAPISSLAAPFVHRVASPPAPRLTMLVGLTPPTILRV